MSSSRSALKFGAGRRADDQVGLLVRLNAAGQITDAREPGIEFVAL